MIKTYEELQVSLINCRNIFLFRANALHINQLSDG